MNFYLDIFRSCAFWHRDANKMVEILRRVKEIVLDVALIGRPDPFYPVEGIVSDSRRVAFPSEQEPSVSEFL